MPDLGSKGGTKKGTVADPVVGGLPKSGSDEPADGGETMQFEAVKGFDGKRPGPK